MIRLLAGGVVNLLANVVALVVASLIVPDLTPVIDVCPSQGF